MQRIIAAAFFALFAFVTPLHAQSFPNPSTMLATVVASCGAQSLGTGPGHYLYMDQTGNFCTSGSGGGGGGAVTIANGADTVEGTITTAHGCSVAGYTVIGCLGQIDDDVKGPIPAGTNVIGGTVGSYFNNVVGSTLTRIANTTAYAANETVCLFTSTTVCAPGTISIATANGGKGLINRVTLLKSGSSVTNATFTIWLFSAAPGTAIPNQFDATSYTGPRAADMPNYIGNAQCTSPVVTSDTTAQVWYDCALSNPNTGGALDFQALSGSTNINYLISVTAAYTPASGETFIPSVSGIY